MPSLPRLAIGTVQDDADLRAALIALFNTLREGGIQVQCYASQSCLPGHWISKAVTGLPGRYLDSWLMSHELCRQLLLRSIGAADLAAVVGQFHLDPNVQAGGNLNTLCEWLDLPKLAVVDVALIKQRGLPRRPDVDGVLLDRASDLGTAAAMITDVESLWGLPVIGVLGNVEEGRRHLLGLEPGSAVPRNLCDLFSASFRECWRPEKFAQLVDRGRPLEIGSPECIYDLPARKPTVAVAYDEAFFGYFPSTLDQLELLGAQVVDFSPLRDESLPPNTDIVYLGCGRPEAYAAALSENHCMKSALRSHVASGGRIYGEVGGAAYLSQTLETCLGEIHRMCGILPTVARFQSGAVAEPVEICVQQENWLAPQGTRLRGYRTGRWRFEAMGCHQKADWKNCCQPDLMGCRCVIGSLIHFHFAALPEIFPSFFRPTHHPVPGLDPWRITT